MTTVKEEKNKIKKHQESSSSTILKKKKEEEEEKGQGEGKNNNHDDNYDGVEDGNKEKIKEEDDDKKKNDHNVTTRTIEANKNNNDKHIKDDLKEEDEEKETPACAKSTNCFSATTTTGPNTSTTTTTNCTILLPPPVSNLGTIDFIQEEDAVVDEQQNGKDNPGKEEKTEKSLVKGVMSLDQQGGKEGDNIFKEEVPAAEESKLENTTATTITADTNFTWEHFFVHHCGILPEDALKYESHLIAHRLNPEDTLLESITLIVQYGRIPVGDKLKIAKTIKRQQEALQAAKDAEAEARKLLGLEDFNEFEAKWILSLGYGTREKWEIEAAIDEFKFQMQELEQAMAVALIQNPEAHKGRMEGSKAGSKVFDPTLRLLHSFGYTTFDYTQGKSVPAAVPQMVETAAGAAAHDILFGNFYKEEEEEPSATSSSMMYN